MIIALIPARSGSKSIKNKNLILLGGKPLIAWSIQTALSCPQINKVIVSTDSQKYAQVAKKFGAEVPFLRPKSLATNKSPITLTIKYTLERLKKMNHQIETVVLLQPTNPFRRPIDLVTSLEILKKPKTDAVVGVCEAEKNPYFVMAGIKNNYLIYPLFKTKKLAQRRQEAKKVYRINGCLYTFKTKAFFREKTVFLKRTRPLIMPQEISVDIDTPADLLYAHFLLKNSKLLVGMKTGSA